jgi:hypothetical protein
MKRNALNWSESYCKNGMKSGKIRSRDIWKRLCGILREKSDTLRLRKKKTKYQVKIL